MNPLRWVRWKVVGVLGVLAALVYFLGLDSVALSKINSAGKESQAARWAISDFGLGLLGGNVKLEDLLVATPRSGDRTPAQPVAAPAPKDGGKQAEQEEQVLSTKLASVDLSMSELLRRRYVVDEVAFEAPTVTVSRRPDGTINIEELGGEKPGEPVPEGQRGDWLETAKRWYERIQKVREKIPDREPREKKEPSYRVDYSRGASYPFEGRPGVILREIVGSNFRIRFEDESSKAPIPSLEKGTIRISEVTSSPSVQERPTRFELSGEIAGSLLRLGGEVDFRKGASSLAITGDTGDLPASLIEAFIGESLPVRLKSGTVKVDLKSLALAPDRLEVLPSLTFRQLQLEPKDPAGKIAGLDASRFAEAFNEASREAAELTIADLKITGTLLSPKFEWGDTVKNLVLSGGKAFAKSQGAKLIDQGLEKGTGALEKSGAGGVLKDKLKDVKGKDLLEKGLGIFGGGTEKASGDKK